MQNVEEGAPLLRVLGGKKVERLPFECTKLKGELISY